MFGYLWVCEELPFVSCFTDFDILLEFNEEYDADFEDNEFKFSDDVLFNFFLRFDEWPNEDTDELLCFFSTMYRNIF